MANSFFKAVEGSVKYWFLPFIVGVLFIGVGIWALFDPSVSLLVLAVIFSIMFLFSGAFDMFFAVINRNELENWGWILVIGIVNFIIGLLLIMNPAISMITLSFYVGFWVLFRAIMAISSSIDLRHYGILDWGYLLVIGVIGIILAVILLANPDFAGISLVVWVGISFIIIGIYSIYLSFRLGVLHKIANQISVDLREKYYNIQSEIQREIKAATKTKRKK